jgi:hypothetical protein
LILIDRLVRARSDDNDESAWSAATAASQTGGSYQRKNQFGHEQATRFHSVL